MPETAHDVDTFLEAFGPKLDKLEAKATPEPKAEKEEPAPEPDEPSDQPEGDEPDEDPADDPEGDEPKESEDEESEEQPESDEPTADEGDDEPDTDPSFEDAAERHSLPTEFEDVLATIPDADARKKARAAFKKRLGEMQSGFTKAQMEATSFRAEKRIWEAEREYLDTNPGKSFVHAYAKMTAEQRETLLDEINAEVEKIDGTNGYARVYAHEFEQGVTSAGDSVREQIAEQERREKRGRDVSLYTHRAAKKAGVPADATGIIEAVVATILSRRTFEDGREKAGDITEDEIDQIVAQKAKLWRHRTGYVKREAKRDYNKDKLAARKKAPKQTGGQGSGHVPVKPPASDATLEEKMLATASRLFPGAP